MIEEKEVLMPGALSEDELLVSSQETVIKEGSTANTNPCAGINNRGFREQIAKRSIGFQSGKHCRRTSCSKHQPQY